MTGYSNRERLSADQPKKMHESPHKLVILGVFLAVVGGYAIMAVNYPVAYIWATYEDFIGEWSQTYFFLAAAILSVFVALRKTHYRWFFVVLTFACSYVVLEEISWGQRIFGFSTPEFLTARNLQGEANLHNVFAGPYSTLLKDSLSIALALGLIGYGLVYPIARSLNWRIALWLDRLGVAPPPVILWPFFTVAGIFELKPLSFNEAEIAELLIGMALAVTALHYGFAALKNVQIVGDGAWSRNDSFVMGRWLITMLTTVVALAALTTFAFYSSPENKVRVDNRIERGVEKFAGRYERYDRCDIANELYARLLGKSPRRVSVIRRMAACYQEMGQDELYRQDIARAIEIDLETYVKEPWRASINRSLVRSYRLAGDLDKASKHLEEGLEIGLKRIKDKPGSASAAYSLGRTLLLADRRQEALEQFTKAYEKDPTSSKYRKAYYSAR